MTTFSTDPEQAITMIEDIFVAVQRQPTLIDLYTTLTNAMPAFRDCRPYFKPQTWLAFDRAMVVRKRDVTIEGMRAEFLRLLRMMRAELRAQVAKAAPYRKPSVVAPAAAPPSPATDRAQELAGAQAQIASLTERLTASEQAASDLADTKARAADLTDEVEYLRTKHEQVMEFLAKTPAAPRAPEPSPETEALTRDLEQARAELAQAVETLAAERAAADQRKDDLAGARQAAAEAQAALNAERAARQAAERKAKRSAASAKAGAPSQEAIAFSNGDEALAVIRASVSDYSGELRAFTDRLLDAADSILDGKIAQAAGAGDLHALKAEIKRLECVYEPLPAAALLSPKRGHDQLAGLRAVQMLAVAQQMLHGAMQSLGIEAIAPESGDAYAPERHRAPDELIVWVNADDEQDRVVSVVKIGFLASGAVLRHALVRRQVRLAGAAPDHAPLLEMIETRSPSVAPDPEPAPEALLRELFPSR